MDAFRTLENTIIGYRNYLISFLSIADERIKDEVAKSFVPIET